VTISWK